MQNMVNTGSFSKKLINWYEQNKRDLPWRNVSDPYKIWLSEIILQQTRVNQGMPYYHKFVELFPTVEDLAQADESKVLRAWQGLGYYSRARNLHRCAKVIVQNYVGMFPKTYDELVKLPGVGPYTAAAIASFAFGEATAVVDGNVFRALSRIFGIEDDINSGKGQKTFRALANELIPANKPAEFNQGLMEFGSIQCTPTNPHCEECVFQSECFAYKNDLQSSLPVKVKKVKIKKRYFNYLVFKKGNALFMQERQAKDIWKGMYDFPLIESQKPLSKKELLIADELKPFNIYSEAVSDSHEYKHILSHQHLYTRFFLVERAADNLPLDKGRFFSYEEILDLPKPVLISSYLKDYIF
ncbi:A/G-specific adenine glycosylase [Fulvivirga lutea]|uniref:Adenine DNA glycosylase n=1 Tax=Fulvivirga lutea TaxID=2810512 RepID=A0A975A164_9BACT|nr:A/G-specific adenine glycosylase [Fulvivirga lutea]QSE97971.1 A/G-specific adenine glycosylase [Fulvivirga lutea]